MKIGYQVLYEENRGKNCYYFFEKPTITIMGYLFKETSLISWQKKKRAFLV
jgi:hypothetical protein